MACCFFFRRRGEAALCSGAVPVVGRRGAESPRITTATGLLRSAKPTPVPSVMVQRSVPPSRRARPSPAPRPARPPEPPRAPSRPGLRSRSGRLGGSQRPLADALGQHNGPVARVSRSVFCNNRPKLQLLLAALVRRRVVRLADCDSSQSRASSEWVSGKRGRASASELLRGVLQYSMRALARSTRRDKRQGKEFGEVLQPSAPCYPFCFFVCAVFRGGHRVL